ncbi:hypothetical protein BaRGS_00029753 [Batillaria attramentaria]|uniref:Uncharacterized protein n=1 Tax=Batillaria attramentaria TaxID=370345 RepID=A0ABD0JVJ2_9CAEN
MGTGALLKSSQRVFPNRLKGSEKSGLICTPNKSDHSLLLQPHSLTHGSIICRACQVCSSNSLTALNCPSLNTMSLLTFGAFELFEPVSRTIQHMLCTHPNFMHS